MNLHSSWRACVYHVLEFSTFRWAAAAWSQMLLLWKILGATRETSVPHGLFPVRLRESARVSRSLSQPLHYGELLKKVKIMVCSEEKE